MLNAVGKRDQNEPDVTEEQVVNFLLKLNVGHYYIKRDVLISALASVNSGGKESKAQIFTIAEQRDAKAVAKMSADKMRAELRVSAPYGGKSISWEDALDALKLAGITAGIQRKALEALLSKAKFLKAGEEATANVAFGKPASNGKDGRLRYLKEDAASRVLQPKERSDGTVDMKDLGDAITVKSGEPLAIMSEETTGVDGYKVNGERLPSVPGKPLKVKFYDGSVLSENDQRIIVSTREGMPIRHPDGVEVDDALVLKAVTPTTGHIKFSGSVVVRGDVSPGMKILASGSVTIGGTVESASIRAGSDIVVQHGVIGRHRENTPTCQLVSGGSIVANFAQFSSLKAQDNIHLKLHACNAYIEAGGNVVISEKLRKQSGIYGGMVKAGLGVVTSFLGAPAGTPTEVYAYCRYQEFIDRLEALETDIEASRGQLSKAIELQRKLERIPESKRPPDLFDKIFVTRQHYSGIYENQKTAQEGLREELNEGYGLYDITVTMRLYQGVRCFVGKHKLSIDSEHGPSKVKVRENEILHEPLR
ncbi:FapA family protein [Parasalinivibrio latis]